MPSTAPPRLSSRWFRWLMLAAALFYAVFILRTGFRIGDRWYFTLFDDAMISMRYARHVAEGFGPVWNPGQAPVEGYTNFLWVLVMAVVHWLPLSDALTSLAVMGIGAALLLANVWTVRRITERLTGGRAGPALAAGALVAFYYPLVFWTLRGMEVGALALLISVSVLLLLRLRERGSGTDLALLAVLTSAAVLTRSDAVLPALTIALFAPSLMTPRRGLAVSLVVLAAALVTLAAHSAFRQQYYGDPLPNTYYLKLTGVTLAERVGRGAGALLDLLVEHLAPLLGLAGLGLIARPRPWRGFQGFLLALVLGQCAYSVYVGGDVWESMGGANRFICVAMPLLWVAVVVAGDSLLPRQDFAPDARRVRRVASPLLAFGGVLLLGAAGFHGWASREWRTTGYALRGEQVVLTAVATVGALLLLALSLWLASSRRTVRVDRLLTRMRSHGGVLAVVAVVGLWQFDCGTQTRYWLVANAKALYDDVDHATLGVILRRHTDPECTVAMSWAGSIAYFSRRPCIDTLGKNDAVIARMEPVGPFVPGHNKHDLDYSVGELRPDVVCLGSTEPMLLPMGYDTLGNDLWVRRDSTLANRARLSRPWHHLTSAATRELWKTQGEIRDAARSTGLIRQWLSRWFRSWQLPESLEAPPDQQPELVPPELS